MTIATKALFAAGLASLFGLAIPNTSNAHDRDRLRDRYRSSARAENSRMTEFQRDRAELRRDQAELQRDREDLQRLYRSGASRQEIARKRQEVRDDMREIAQDHRELSDSMESVISSQDRALGRDRIFSSRDRSGRYDNDRSNNSGLGWGSDRRYDRDSWGLGDLLGLGWGR